MRRSLWQLFIESFAAVNGLLGGILAIVLAVALYVVIPLDVIVRLLVGALALVVVMSAIVIFTLLHALVRQSRTSMLPRIRAGRQPFAGTSATFVCVADPSEFFYMGIWVSFYRISEQGFEEPIGIGHVINVQEDGKILLEMISVSEEHEDFAERVRNNDAGALERLRVKPYVPQQLFGPYEEQR